MNNSYEEYLNCWLDGIKDEIAFWNDFFKSKGAIVPQCTEEIFESETQYEPDFKLEEDLEAKETKFLDVGSGPYSRCGIKTDKTNLDFTAVDPLACIYKTLKYKYSIKTKIQPQTAMVENLSLKFNENEFDIVHMSNSLDHSFDAIVALWQMLYVCKVGGKIILRHHQNEAETENYTGFHQWNLALDDGKFIIWRKDTKCDVGKILKDYAEIIEASPEIEKTGTGTWEYNKIVIRKLKPCEPHLNENYPMLLEKILERICELYYEKFSSKSGNKKLIKRIKSNFSGFKNKCKKLPFINKLFVRKHKSIYISGWINGDNYGDNYLSDSVYGFIHSYFPDYDIKKVPLLFNTKNVSKDDIVIIAGGGLFGPSKTGSLEENVYKMWMSLPSKLIIANIGIDSFDEKYLYQLIDIIDKSSLITFRDIESFLLAKNYIDDEKVTFGADSTFFEPIVINKVPKFRNIGINITGPETENYSNTYSIDSIIQSVISLKNHGYIISSVPFSTSKIADDYKYCKLVDANCPKSFSHEIYQNCEIFIGMRFHSILIALQNNIPVIAINYSNKVRRLMKEYELEDFCIEPNNVNENNLYDLVTRLYKQKESIIDTIKKHNKCCYERINGIKTKLINLLK